MTTSERLRASLGRSYRLDRELGQGGMATVYLAHDLKHDRDVAIKVLHPDLGAALGGERFLSEIRTTARLQHPHILPLLDSGDADGLLYYVMPLVTGETLRARLDRERQLPIADAVRIARDVASALDYAHRQNVIHRDIKPENILLHDGSALVADFGIALAVQSAGGQRMTQTGLSLGTPSYMSPEQAMGERTIDARSDMYALGAVTYEMLVGEAPFTGATVQAIVAKVLSAEPQAPTLIRNTIPPYVEGAVLKSLAKLPADRWTKASDFAAALAGESAATQYVTRGGATQTAAARMSTRARALLAFTTIVATVATSSALWLATRTAPMQTPARFDVLLPDSVALFNVSGRRLALSNDGTQLVAAATKGDTTRLYVRRIDETEFRPIAGTERLSYTNNVDPVFSTDGRSILFRASKALMRIPVAGGRAERIGPDATASWGDGDRVVWVSGDTLWKIESGGAAKFVMAVFDPAATRRKLIWPSILPGGHYALVNLAALVGLPDDNHIGVISIDDGRVEDLGFVGTNAQYSSTGHIVFGRATGDVFAVPFSLGSRKVQGQPERILDGIWIGPAGAVGVAVSQNGTLAYHEGSDVARQSTLWVVNENGTERMIAAPQRTYISPRVSPDGKRVVVEQNVDSRSAPDSALVVIDLRTGATQQLASPGEGLAPEWSRDGQRITFLKFLGLNGREIISRAWDRSSPDQLLFHSESLFLFDYRLGPTGGWSALRTGSVGASTGIKDIVLAPTDSLSKTRPFLSTPANETTPAISPDGSMLAYATDESGDFEVYVQPIPGPGPRVQISLSGGSEPIWSPQGGTIFYRAPSRQVMAARLVTSPLRVAKWDTLFIDRFVRQTTKATNWSVFPNGRDFLLLGGARSNGNVKVVTNWPQLRASQRAASESR